MKNYNEIAESVLSRRDEYERAQSIKRKNITRLAGIASAFVLVAVLATGILKGGWLGLNSLTSKGDKTGDIPGNVKEQSTSEIMVENIPKEQTSNGTDQLQSENDLETEPDGGIYGGDMGRGFWFIPALPQNREIRVVGEVLTDEQAQEYFKANKETIFSSLSQSGVTITSPKISEKGYSHVSYDGTQGETFVVRQNFRDYLVYDGDKLVAIITLVKENGVIYSTPSFGAKWFEYYNAFLQKHKGEKLVYVYAKNFEIIIAPDNICYSPMGNDFSSYPEGAENPDVDVPAISRNVATLYFEGVENPYEVFYHESAVYVP